ncbi:glycoside hydrolase family 5 protein [Viridothelium virens]|uniref:Glycoside hydrolase family 5 protein n=1 Tax=Viridothelium virens TaxID=1048519 RepID=A0A6A6H077_VIRVR|nr:glycoside hydrolase family 5 protein [Viridothelium virens]
MADENTSQQKVSQNNHDNPQRLQAPTRQDTQRFRFHQGTNLGGCYTLEQWLTPSMYPPGCKTSELAAVTSSIEKDGLAATRAKWERHWQNFVKTDDWYWLVEQAHCTTIRLPFGYFTLGPTFCESTPFETASSVYTDAWKSVKSFINTASNYGIGVLLDFHALPGGANGSDHSGTNSGVAGLWGNQFNLDLTRRCLVFLATEIKSCNLSNVVGLQFCNEANYSAPGLYTFYDDAIATISRIDENLPLYISDGWDLSMALSYANSKNTRSSGANPIIVDTHKYWAFSDADKTKSPQQIIHEVQGQLSELVGREGSVCEHRAGQVVVGEYSCVLTEESWAKAADSDRTALAIAFGQAQSRRWQEKAGGSFFWTWKMDWMPGGGWGFVKQSKTGAISPPFNLLLSQIDVSARRQSALEQQHTRRVHTVDAHCNYWDRNCPGQYFEHWRYESGWKVGFADAAEFFGARAKYRWPGTGGDKIGCLEVWCRKRIIESGMQGPFVWEFEHGLRAGIRDFYSLAGI